ncbi:MAG: YfhO family protein [bacterium]
MTPFLLIFLLAFLFLSKLFLLNEIFFLRDFGAYFYPLRHLTLEFLNSKIIPFWNPYIDSGVCLLADLQSQILYPPSLFLLLGFDIGLKLFILFHFILGGFSIYVLARHLGLNSSSSFVSVCVFIFSGFFVSSTYILTAFASSAWIPLIFYLFLKKRVFLAGFAIAFQFLAGELSILYGTILSLFFYSISKKGIKEFVLAGLIGLSISLFQTLPFFEFVSLSTRGKIGFEHATYWSFAPYELLRLFIPSIMGSPIDITYRIGDLFKIQLWLNSPYIGIIPLLLIFISFKARRGMFFFFLFFFSLLLSFGKYTPLYDIFAHLPFFGLLRYPVKFISIFTFASSILAGYGFSYLYEKKGFSLFFVFSIIFGAIALFLFFGKQEVTLFMGKYVEQSYAFCWIEDVFKDTLFLFIILSSSFLLIFLLNKDKIKKPIFASLFIGLIVVELFFFAQKINPTTSGEIYKFKPRVLEFIKNQKGLFRVLITPITNKHLAGPLGFSYEECFLRGLVYLKPNLGLIHKIFYTSGYRSISLSDYSSFMYLIELSKFSDVSHLISLINTRYIISEHPLDEKSLKFLFRDGKQGPFLYENMDCLPRAFMVYNHKAIKHKEILEYMLSQQFDPREEVVLEEKPEKFKMQNAKCKTEVRIIKYQPNRVVIKVETERHGFLVLSDTYYPGWKAFIKTKNLKLKTKNLEVKIYKANYCFRAIALEKGNYVVEFRYFPRTFIIGLIASLVSFVLILGAFLLKR